jgi:hypothetical protein
MSAINRAASIRAKIERADEHVRDLAANIRSFWATPNRYAFGPEDDPQTGDKVFHIHGNDLTPPLRFSIIVGEVVHNLRSALDHLAWQLVLANGRTPGRHIQFPIFEEPHTVKEYKTKVDRMIKGASDGAMRLVKSLNAYKGGDAPALCIVSALNNVDKHRLLVTIGLARFDNSVSAPVYLEDGAEVYRLRANVQNTFNMDTDLQAPLDIALREPGIIEGEPLAPCLHQLTEFVDTLWSIPFSEDSPS